MSAHASLEHPVNNDEKDITMKPIDGQVVLVTGGGVGIGKDIAIKLAQDGADVAVTYLSHEADDTVTTIETLGRRARAYRLDATNSSEVDSVVAGVVQDFGRLDILVNNAGGLVRRCPIPDMTDEFWHQVIDVNLSSALFCIRAATKHLSAGARILNMSSLAAQNGGGSGASAYAAAKAGMIGLTRAAAKELGPQGVTVNAIAAGFIDDTPFHATFSPPAAQQTMIEQSAVRRAGQPADVSAAVSFLVSPEAGFLNGVTLDLNGGTYFS